MSKKQEEKSLPFNGNHWVALRTGILEACESGQMTPMMFAVFCHLLLKCQYDSGVWKGSAPKLVAEFGNNLDLDTAKWCLRELEKRGFVRRFNLKGSRHNYAVLIEDFEPASGPLRGKAMRLCAAKCSKHGPKLTLVYEQYEDKLRKLIRKDVQPQPTPTAILHVSLTGRYPEITSDTNPKLTGDYPELTPELAWDIAPETTRIQEVQEVPNKNEKGFKEEKEETAEGYKKRGDVFPPTGISSSTFSSSSSFDQTLALDDDCLSSTDVVSLSAQNPEGQANLGGTAASLIKSKEKSPEFISINQTAERLVLKLHGYLMEAGGVDDTSWRKNWAPPMKQILDRYGNNADLIEQVMEWLFKSNHKDALFWLPTVGSAKQLDKHFAKINRQMIAAQRTAAPARNSLSHDPKGSKSYAEGL